MELINTQLYDFQFSKRGRQFLFLFAIRKEDFQSFLAVPFNVDIQDHPISKYGMMYLHTDRIGRFGFPVSYWRI